MDTQIETEPFTTLSIRVNHSPDGWWTATVYSGEGAELDTTDATGPGHAEMGQEIGHIVNAEISRLMENASHARFTVR